MSGSLRKLVEARSRTQKWLLGILVAGVAAALTGIVANAVTSGADRARGAFEESKPPVGLTVGKAIQADRRANLSSTHWIFTKPLSEIKYPNSGNLGDAKVWEAWARKNGGIESSTTGIEVVIEGTTPYPVILTGLTVDVVRRAPPPRGIRIVPFGGGPVGKRLFNVDLDDNPPTITALPDEFSDAGAIDFPYQVSQTDPEVFRILASTNKCDCSWRAKLHWVYHGQQGVTVIDDNGQPFRTASPSNTTSYLAINGRFTPAA
jgi:hypothetical protein